MRAEYSFAAQVSQEKTHLRQSLIAIPLYTDRPGTKMGRWAPEAVLTRRPGTKTGGRQLIVIQKDAEFKVQIPAL